MTNRPTLRDLVARYGGYTYAGGERALIPGPGHSKSDLSLSLWENSDGRVVFHTFAGDSPVTIFKYLGFETLSEDALTPHQRAKAKRERQLAMAADRQRKMAFCSKIWNAGVPIPGTMAETYLRNDRGIRISTYPPVLRYCELTPRNYENSHAAPALIALAHHESGEPCAIHATYLSRKGWHNGRCMFGPVRGASVRLHEHADEMAVGEGLESVLSYSALTERPVWSLLSTSQFATFNPPSDTDTLHVAVDLDDKKGHGLALAEKMRDRLANSRPGLQVALDCPPAGLDWNSHHRALQGLSPREKAVA